MPDSLPSGVQQFLREHIGTIAQLELLLLVQRGADKCWTAEEAAKLLYIPGSFAESIFASLESAGLVKPVQGSQPSYQFSPRSTGLSEVVNDVAKFYRERPVATIEAIHSRNADRLQNFADAFRLRKKKED